MSLTAQMGEEEVPGGFTWVDHDGQVDWDELSELYRVAPLGVKPPEVLSITFPNSKFKCFVYKGGQLVGAGRAIADGVDTAYLADVAVHPDLQGLGLGKAIIRRLVEMADGHRKVILYANPGKEGFYEKLGFLPMKTAMAIWSDREWALEGGLLGPGPPA